MSTNSSIWRALADPKRRQIINLLKEKPHTTNELSTFFDVSRFAIMKHLKVLEQANLIEVQREGRKRWNMLHEDLADFLSEPSQPFQFAEESANMLLEKRPFPPVRSLREEPTLIKQAVVLNATSAQVFQAITGDITAWWALRTANSSAVYLEPRLNGRLHEAFNRADQGVLYGTVTYIKQDEEIRLAGTHELSKQVLGMFIPNNVVRIVLESRGDSTHLTLNHYLPSLLTQEKRESALQHWRRLLDHHLKPFVEEGARYAFYQ